MRTLIHICCAPCLIAPLEALRSEGVELHGLFYNPNVHPFLEFRKRVKAVRVLLETERLPVEIVEEYGLDYFVQEVYAPDKDVRCRRCYEVRLHRAAHRARELALDAFTTTMLVSPHQNHEVIRAVGTQVGEEVGVPFLYRDFRPLDDGTHQVARKKGLYLQNYCGCCFSEYERFRDTDREVYHGGSGRGEG